MTHRLGGVEEKGGVGLPFADFIRAEHGGLVGGCWVGEAVDEICAGEGEGCFFERGVGGDAAVWSGGSQCVEGVEEVVDAFEGGDADGVDFFVHAIAVVGHEVGEFFAQVGFDILEDVGEVSAFEVGDGVLGVDFPAGITDALGEDAVGEGFGVDEYAVAVEDDEVGVEHDGVRGGPACRAGSLWGVF